MKGLPIFALVRGYTTTKSLTMPPESGSEQNIVKDLLSQKQALMLELKHYENNSKYNDDVTTQDHGFDNVGVIPADTRLQVAIATSNKTNEKVGNTVIVPPTFISKI